MAWLCKRNNDKINNREEKKEAKKVNWFQSSIICPFCQESYYRIDEKCNKCKKEVKEPIPKKIKKHVIGSGRGKQWSRKLHRYLTEKDIRKGMTGG